MGFGIFYGFPVGWFIWVFVHCPIFANFRLNCFKILAMTKYFIISGIGWIFQVRFWTWANGQKVSLLLGTVAFFSFTVCNFLPSLVVTLTVVLFSASLRVMVMTSRWIHWSIASNTTPLSAVACELPLPIWCSINDARANAVHLRHMVGTQYHNYVIE